MNAIISWFTRNGVAANLLMASIIMAGIFTLAYRVPLEVFPDFAMDRITVNMPYRGATPAEVEEVLASEIETTEPVAEEVPAVTETPKPAPVVDSGPKVPGPKPRKDFSSEEKAAMLKRAKAHAAEVAKRKG